MFFETDMRHVQDVLGEMQGKFEVANRVGFSAKDSPGDNWQVEVRKKIANSEEYLKWATVKVDAEFYRAYGEYIVEKLPKGIKTALKCFDFNAYVSGQLRRKGFEGSIKKGLLGISTMSGHEFLLLYWECDEQYRRILDVWSHLQTEQPALCVLSEFGNLLPGSVLKDSLKNKGIAVMATLKPGTCP